MTREELKILLQEEVQDLIRKHSDASPEDVALHLAKEHSAAKLIASQVKYVQKAQKKLPQWVMAGCLFTRQSIEQCSSEVSADLRPLISGHRALDLTCGLGVDAWHLSHHFEQVVAVEADPTLAELARINFARLGRENIQVVHASAEVYLANLEGERFDLIFVDPDRRPGSGGRRFLLQDCSPDVIDLEERLLELGKRVRIKASPLLDVTESLRLLSNVAGIGAVGVDQEVKELIIDQQARQRLQRWAAFARGGVTYLFEGPSQVPKRPPVCDPTQSSLVLEADPSLYKMALVDSYFAELGLGMDDPQGYAFSNVIPDGFAGRAFRILEVHLYKPKALKKLLKARKLDRLNLSRRAFDLPLAKVRQQLGLKEGGGAYLLFTRWNGQRWAILCERVEL